jgi:hypothetical protein
MLIPTKHEKLENNILVVGAFIIEELLNGTQFIETILENYIKKKKDADIDTFYDSLLFLYCIDAIDVSNYTVRLINK